MPEQFVFFLIIVMIFLTSNKMYTKTYIDSCIVCQKLNESRSGVQIKHHPKNVMPT